MRKVLALVCHSDLVRATEGFLHTRSRKAQTKGCLFICIATLSLAALLWFAQPPPVSNVGFDVFVLLDAGWRIVNGQHPHTDYFSPIGPLYQSFIALGMLVSPTDRALALAHTLLFVLITSWTWLVARSRCSVFFSAFLALYLGLLAATPRPLSHPMDAWGYSMAYNRVGWALTALLCLSMCVACRTGRRRTTPDLLASAASEGGLLATLLLTKLSYFLVVLPAALLILYRSKPHWKWVACRLAVCLLVSATVLLGLGIEIGDFVSDMGLVLTHGAGGIPSKLISRVLPNAEDLCLLPLVAVMSFPAQQRFSLRRGFAHPPIQLALVVTLTGIVICAGNAQFFEIPLIPIAGLVLLKGRRRRGPSSGWRAARTSIVASLLVLGLASRILLRDVGSLAWSLKWLAGGQQVAIDKAFEPRVHAAEYVRIDSRAIDGLSFPKAKDDLWDSPASYAAHIAEGLGLLRRNVEPRSRVLDMAGTPNPYPFLLGLPSPKGTALFWELGPSSRIISFLEPEAAFHDVTTVVWSRSKFHGKDVVPGSFTDRYGNYVRQHFEIRDQSTNYYLLERR